MRIVSIVFMHAIVLALAGCATAQPINTGPGPVRLDELVALSGQGAGDDAVIATIEQRGVAFVLTPSDVETQRTAGVSEGVLRYLQGRSAGEQSLRARIVAGRPVPTYYGAIYLGYPYLGYYDGLHYYGGGSYYYGGGSYYYGGGHRRTHVGGHHGGQHGGGHSGGHGGRH